MTYISFCSEPVLTRVRFCPVWPTLSPGTEKSSMLRLVTASFEESSRTRLAHCSSLIQLS